MQSPYERQEKIQATAGKKKIHYVRLMPISENSNQQQNVIVEDKYLSQQTTSPQPAMTDTRGEDKVTQPNLRTMGHSSFFLNFDDLDYLPPDSQPTMIVPAIENSRKDIKLETQGLGETSYASLIRNLIKSSGIYALSSIATPFVSLALAPFLTHQLSSTDYGILAILNTVISLLAGLTQLGLASAFFRSYSYDYETPKDRLNVLSTAVILMSLISIPITLLVMLAAPWLSMFLFKTPSLSDPLRITALVVLMQNLCVPGLTWLRAKNRAMIFSILTIANLLITLLATIVLVGPLHLAVAGALIANGCGYAFIVICTIPYILLRAGIRLRFDIAHGLITFGLPQVSGFVSMWILQLSDRFLLGRLGSLSQTAAYSLAYSLGSVLSVVVLSPFQLAWPSVMFPIAKKDNAAQIFRPVFGWYSIIILFATFGLSLLSTIVLNLFFPLPYHAAAPIIPIIALSMMFYGFYYLFMTGSNILRKVWFIFLFTAVAAIVNVILNLFLIPAFGSMGAALATLLAYALLAGIAYIVNQRIYPVPFKIHLYIIALFVGIVLYIGSGFLTQGRGTIETWGIFFSALALYGGCLACLGVMMTRSRQNKYRQEKKEEIL
jgi:O-antigen/teichoic acid export membrane protein